MRSHRASGLLLHPTSLPGRFGSGDLGPEAFRFIDTLAGAGQTYWQILPLGPTGWGDSPYSSFSAFAGNPLLISPEALVEDGLLDETDITPHSRRSSGAVDYGEVYEWKPALIAQALDNLWSRGPQQLRADYERFVADHAWWLDDYALFRVIKIDEDHRPWNEWAEERKQRDENAINAARSSLGREIDEIRFGQFIFYRQWSRVRSYANERGIRIIGDVPIFVAFDSADVWVGREQFKLDADGSPRVVSGVPPDYFSKTGQLWGNPIYDWDRMSADGFEWWVRRIGHALTLYDLARLDHFIGFVRMWEVPGRERTAENGQWVAAPGGELLGALQRAFPDMPFIAEDLGAITPEVERLRDAFDLPGMRILQYGFGGNPNDIHLPHNYVQNCVAYIGTHDNDTAIGWYRAAPKEHRSLAREYLNANGRRMHRSLMRGVMSSVADTVIISVQDLLGLGSAARMNIPAIASGNWQWRLKEGQITDEDAEMLRRMTAIYGRERSAGS